MSKNRKLTASFVRKNSKNRKRAASVQKMWKIESRRLLLSEKNIENRKSTASSVPKSRKIENGRLLLSEKTRKIKNQRLLLSEKVENGKSTASSVRKS